MLTLSASWTRSHAPRAVISPVKVHYAKAAMLLSLEALAPEVPDSAWTGDAEVSVSVRGKLGCSISPATYLDRDCVEESWDGNTEFMLEINGRGTTIVH
jgi:hypothetical protein